MNRLLISIRKKTFYQMFIGAASRQNRLPRTQFEQMLPKIIIIFDGCLERFNMKSTLSRSKINDKYSILIKMEMCAEIVLYFTMF